MTVAAGGLLLFVGGWLAPVLAPLGLGLFIAALAAPAVGWLTSRGASTAMAMLITVGLVLAVGAALVVLALTSARTLADSLSAYAADIDARFAEGGALADGLRAVLPEDALVAVLRAVVAIIWQVASAFGFAVVLAALLLLDGRRLASLARHGPAIHAPVLRELPDVARAAVTYFAVRIRVNLTTAVGLLVLMLILGVDDALLWAVGAFFLSFVPYLGLILALIPPTILAFAESGPLAAIGMVVGGTALNLLAENLLEPTLTGRALRLSTWLVFAMFFFWVWILGPVGALLSMPITVLIVLLLDHNENTQWLAALLMRKEAAASPGSE